MGKLRNERDLLDDSGKPVQIIFLEALLLNFTLQISILQISQKVWDGVKELENVRKSRDPIRWLLWVTNKKELKDDILPEIFNLIDHGLPGIFNLKHFIARF